MKQVNLRLPEETIERLKRLAKETDRTMTFYIKQAIEKHLSELEDKYK